jgi:hypothetical protein
VLWKGEKYDFQTTTSPAAVATAGTTTCSSGLNWLLASVR